MCPSAHRSCRPDKASAKDSRLATSFLLGRRRLSVLDEDFSILETKEECLIFCLSLLEGGKGRGIVKRGESDGRGLSCASGFYAGSGALLHGSLALRSVL